MTLSGASAGAAWSSHDVRQLEWGVSYIIQAAFEQSFNTIW